MLKNQGNNQMMVEVEGEVENETNQKKSQR